MENTAVSISGKNAYDKIYKANGETKISKFKNVVMNLCEFDTDELDTARIIYFKKEDIKDRGSEWFFIVKDGLDLIRSQFADVRFNVSVKFAKSSLNNEYNINKLYFKLVKGKEIAAKCFSSNIDINFSDIIRIDIQTAMKFGKQYKGAYIFILN